MMDSTSYSPEITAIILLLWLHEVYCFGPTKAGKTQFYISIELNTAYLLYI